MKTLGLDASNIRNKANSCLRNIHIRLWQFTFYRNLEIAIKHFEAFVLITSASPEEMNEFLHDLFATWFFGLRD